MLYPLELLRGAWLLYRMHLGTILGSRRTLAAVVLAAAPAVITVLAAIFGPGHVHGDEIFLEIGMVLMMGFAVPLLGVAMGVGVVASEAEGRTITYPFTRPMPRASLFLGRWLASLTVLLALVAAAVLVMALGAEQKAPGPLPGDPTKLLKACLVGVTLYSLGAAVIGVLFKRGLVVAIGYAFAIEMLLANLPGSVSKVTIQSYLRAILLEGRVGTFGIDMQVNTETLLAPEDALVRLGITAAILLLVGMRSVTRKQFVLTV